MFDIINATFELMGGFALLISVIAIHKSKSADGVSWVTITFFTGWGVWNLFYYPSLGQYWSTIGACSVAGVNFIWLCQIIYYRRKHG